MLRYGMELLSRAMSGDMKFVVETPVETMAATGGPWQWQARVRLVDSYGVDHAWFTGDVAGLFSVATDSAAGSASVSSADASFVNGLAKVTVTGDAASWLEGEKVTLTVAGDKSVMGWSVAGTTSQLTFTPGG